MIPLEEGPFRFEFNSVVDARKFDALGEDGHGLSHCMKAVDFIVETPDFYAYIEVKGSEVPSRELAYKYRDSFLYEWASGKADKPCYYWIVFNNDRFDDALLTPWTEELKRQLPVNGPRKAPWPRPFVRDCAMFTVASWNKRFPAYPVTRIA